MKATKAEQKALAARFPKTAKTGTTAKSAPLVNDAPKNKNGVLVNKPFKLTENS